LVVSCTIISADNNTTSKDTMADDEVATKAPESDAQETSQKQEETQSIIPGDTKAQEGPSMGV
jgi:hypothetical protein